MWLSGNLDRNMKQRGIAFGFSFLRNPAGFSIGEKFVPFNPNDPYIKGFVVGLLNTLQVTIAGIALSTVVGIAAGVAGLSDNWLVRKISQVYVEVARNTPMLLQLFFWYFAVFFQLPRPQDQIEIDNLLYMSKAGVVIPWPQNTPFVWMWLAVLALMAIAALFVWRWRTQRIVEQAASGKPQWMILVGMGVAALLIILLGLGWQFPSSDAPGQVQGGIRLTLEFSALLAGLTFYTGAFIAEIVRAGIQSVSKGQWEAARSLGLGSNLVMRLVVFPQALRVMIPSLNSMYQSLAKNSSLGFAIAFPEIYSVASTTFNQTGRPVEVFILITGCYLLLTLTISVLMNQLNRAVQVKER